MSPLISYYLVVCVGALLPLKNIMIILLITGGGMGVFQGPSSTAKEVGRHDSWYHSYVTI